MFSKELSAAVNDDDQRRRTCHLWLKNGTIQYLDDCDHALAGPDGSTAGLAARLTGHLNGVIISRRGSVYGLRRGRAIHMIGSKVGRDALAEAARRGSSCGKGQRGDAGGRPVDPELKEG